MEFLNEKGEGHIAELILEVDNMEEFYDRMKAKGVKLLSIDGAPLSGDEKYHVVSG